MIRKFTVMAFFALALVASAFSQAIGKIEYLEGAVTVTRDGAALKKADIGTAIENLDQIATSADGMVTIAFDKQSGLTGTLQVVPASTAIIRLDQLSGTKANEVQLMAGSVGLKVKRLAGGKSAIQVRTATAVLGVRGTEFVVASFNGSALVACEEGEVSCSSSSYLTGKNSGSPVSSVPGTMVEVLETGKLNSGAFPAGDFDKNWADMRSKWKNFNVGLLTDSPLQFLEQYAASWNENSAKVIAGGRRLSSNATLTKWFKTASSGKASGSMAEWVKEKPAVMKSLIDLRGDMMLTVITLYRLQEIIPVLPESAMSQTLTTGQTVRQFVTAYSKSAKDVSAVIALFNGAEKQYMLRNDGVSPFS